MAPDEKDELRARVAELETAHAELRGLFGALERRQLRVEKLLTDFQGEWRSQMKAVEAGLEGNRAEIAGLQQKVDAGNGKLDEVLASLRRAG